MFSVFDDKDIKENKNQCCLKITNSLIVLQENIQLNEMYFSSKPILS